MPHSSLYLQNCLYFTANALARNITRMAERAFKDTGLSPSHAFAIMLVNDLPGMTNTELARNLHLAPSTLTRFMDRLVYQGFVERKHKGKIVRIYPTDKARQAQADIEAAWKRLHEDYSAILGEKKGADLTRSLFEANRKLEDLA